MKAEKLARKFSAKIATVCPLIFAFLFVFASAARASSSNLTAPVNTSAYHTSTLLADGRVLFVSGSGKINVISSATIYDQASQTWTPTGALNMPRVQPTATLLANGKVLVVGGYDNNGILASAELYDPTSGSWTITGSLNMPRWLHTATLLANGMVLVAGGNNASGGVSTCELYDPVTGNWTVTGSPSVSHWMHTATLLASGNVLVAGGYTDSGGVAPSEVYNPGTGQWHGTRGSWALETGRIEHTATLLTNGMVLVTSGLGYGSAGYLSGSELFNPATEQWTYTGQLNTARFNPVAVLLTNGEVMVAGGIGTNGVLASVELYDPASGTWTETRALSNVGVNQTATLLPSGNVLITGSFSQPADASAVTALYSPAGQLAATAAIALGNLSQTYNGTARTASVVTSPAGLTVSLTYDGSAIPPVNAGSYTVMATVTALNYVGTATNTLFVGVSPITLHNSVRVNGGFSFSFTNSPGMNFTVLATTNLTASPDAWSALGTATETAPGVYRFSDADAPNYSQRFYRVAL